MLNNLGKPNASPSKKKSKMNIPKTHIGRSGHPVSSYWSDTPKGRILDDDIWLVLRNLSIFLDYYTQISYPRCVWFPNGDHTYRFVPFTLQYCSNFVYVIYFCHKLCRVKSGCYYLSSISRCLRAPLQKCICKEFYLEMYGNGRTEL
jgi:hypothetical protein